MKEKIGLGRKPLFLVVLFILSVFCVGRQPGVLTAEAADTYTSGVWEYTILDDGTAEITGYDYLEDLGGGSLTVPSTLGGRRVTSIGANALKYCMKTSVTVPEGVTRIGSYAFSYTGIERISLPSTLQELGIGVFQRSTELQEIAAASGNRYFSSEDGVLFNKAKTVLYACPGGKTGVYQAPAGVVAVEPRAFCGCESLTEIILPDSVNSIGEWAFAYCGNMEEFLIPAGVLEIGSNTFIDCDSLQTISIPAGVTSIDNMAFRQCANLEEILVDEASISFSSADGVLFSKDQDILYAYPTGKNDASYEVPVTVQYIVSSAFQNCTALTEVTLPDGLLDIGLFAFDGCTGLQEIEIPENAVLNTSAFENCDSLTSVTLYTSPDSFAFAYCDSLKEVNLRDGIEEIGAYAFSGCAALETINIPATVQEIGRQAFANCTSLSEMVIPSSVTEIGTNVFSGCGDLTIYGFSGSAAQSYASANGIDFETVSRASYRVTFNAAGGTVETSSKTVDYYGTYGELPVPVRGGYVFEGWYTAASGGNLVTKDTTVTSAGSHTLYARWAEAAEYTVTFDPAGGTAAVPSKTVTYGSIYGLLPTPVRDGYEFDGWYTSGGERIRSSTIVRTAADQTLYARWELSVFRLIFYPEGGSVYPSSKEVAYGSRVGTLPTPVRTGYEFGGWYTAGSGGEQVTADTMVTGSSVRYLYARWTGEPGTVYFDANGGSVGTSSKVVAYSHTYGSLPVPVRSGYNFVGWYTERSGGTLITQDTEVSILGDHTLYARWEEAQKYLVTFNAGGGSVSTSGKTVTYGAAYGSLPTPVRSGYSFSGWYTSSSGGSRVTESSTVSIQGNHTLYARWAAGTYTVYFNANGGSVSTGSKQVSTGSAYGSLPTPVRSGYVFGGWYTAASGGSLITSGTTFTNGANQTLYAHWQTGTAVTPTLQALSYSFSNSASSFGYGSGYRIPYERYSLIFGDTSQAYNYYRNAGSWGGNCFGITTTSGMMFQSGSGITMKNFNSGATALSQLAVSDYSSLLNLTLRQWIESMQVSQSSSVIQACYSGYRNDLNGLCAQVENFAATGSNPAIIAVFGNEGGHALVGYRIESVSSTESRMYVYDCNYPLTTRYITLYKNSSGSYTGWYYHLNNRYHWGSSYSGSRISYVPYDRFMQVWTNRKGTVNISADMEKEKDLLTLNTGNAEIYDFDGNLVASIQNGAVVTDREDVYSYVNIGLTADETETDGGRTAVWLPADLYTVRNTDPGVGELQASMTNVEQSASVITSAGQVTFAVDDAEALNYVQIEEGNADYEITLSSSLEGTYSDVTMTGTTMEKAVTFSQMAGNLVADGVDLARNGAIYINGVQMTVNGDVATGGNLGTTISSTISPTEVYLDAVSLTMTRGQSRTLAATVLPQTATDRTVTWESSNPSVALVSDTGAVTAVGAGRAVITATAGDVHTVCQVEVLSPFADVSTDSWFCTDVDYVNSRGIMTGIGEDKVNFEPYSNLPRAQFAVIIHRLEGEPAADAGKDFPDVPDSGWYTSAVRWASQDDVGIITGYSSNGMFGPADFIIREQLAVMMFRYASYKGLDNSARADFSGYQDAAMVDDFAVDALQWAVAEGIITGKYDQTQLDPYGYASRAECAIIIRRFMERYDL